MRLLIKKDIAVLRGYLTEYAKVEIQPKYYTNVDGFLSYAEYKQNCSYSEPHLDFAALHFDAASR